MIKFVNNEAYITYDKKIKPTVSNNLGQLWKYKL